jgi:hypothetical protein
LEKELRPIPFVRLVCTLAMVLLVGGCSQEKTQPVPDAATILAAIPPADAAQYEHVPDMKNWRNPYLIVRADGVALLDAADNAEIILKPDDLLGTLAHLPASNWPYGRVVAVTESRASEQDGVAVRRYKGIVGGVLEGAHIAVKWVPAA